MRRLSGVTLPLFSVRTRTDWGIGQITDLPAAASWLLQSGASLMHVRDLLGHSDVRVTQRYAHLQVRDLAKSLHKISTPKRAGALSR